MYLYHLFLNKGMVVVAANSNEEVVDLLVNSYGFGVLEVSRALVEGFCFKLAEPRETEVIYQYDKDTVDRIKQFETRNEELYLH